MSSQLNGVQVKTKKSARSYISHCYAHKSEPGAHTSKKCITERKAFLKTVEGLSALFSKFTKHAY